MQKLQKAIKKIREAVEELLELISYSFRSFMETLSKGKEEQRQAMLEDMVRIAKGEIVENLRPLMTRIITETMTEYRHTYRQNHYTTQAMHDIKASFQIVLDNYISDSK